MNEDIKIIILLIIIITTAILLANKGIWILWIMLVFVFFCGLGSLFAMLASIIHFEIIWALGFFVLMAIAWMIGAAIAIKINLL